MQRWERMYGLPVRRPKPFVVLTHTEELDQWIRNRAADAGTGRRETLDSDHRRISMLIVNEHPMAAELKKVLERAGCEVTAVHIGQPPEGSADAFRADVMLAISFESSMQSTPAATIRPQAARDTSSSAPSDSPSQFS